MSATSAMPPSTGDGVTWTALPEIATRFDTKAEAAVEQAEIVAALGISVAVVPASGAGLGQGPSS